jgi:hypothetical protein
MHFKDEVLDRFTESANIAQFVSFSPEGFNLVLGKAISLREKLSV